eukprot:GHVR01082694.1.p1 GENE.GHVR01082694.1~~GHVR01082694.1.p1  ORF type:complete len:355 (-),score=58.68 GHVR01082694.1:188-1252(-)
MSRRNHRSLQGHPLNINAPAFIPTHTHTSPQEVPPVEVVIVKPVVKKPKVKPVRAMVSAPLGSRSWLRPDKMFLALEDKIELIVHRFTPPQKAPTKITDIIHTLHNIRPSDQPINFNDLDSSDSSHQTPVASQNSSITSSVHHSVSRTPIQPEQHQSQVLPIIEPSQHTHIVPLNIASLLPVVVSRVENVESQAAENIENEQEDDTPSIQEETEEEDNDDDDPENDAQGIQTSNTPAQNTHQIIHNLIQQEEDPLADITRTTPPHMHTARGSPITVTPPCSEDRASIDIVRASTTHDIFTSPGQDGDSTQTNYDEEPRSAATNQRIDRHSPRLGQRHAYQPPDPEDPTQKYHLM